MNNKKLLLASSTKDEAITQWVIKNQPSAFDLLFIDDLLYQYDIWDRVDDEKTSIQWFEENRLKYSNETHYLLNRVTHIDKDLFTPFRSEDREYAQREFEAYLGFAFNSFEQVQHCAVDGMCERVYSLSQQWNIIRNQTPIAIPEYYWGSPDYLPFESNTNLVHSTIYNFLNWSVTDPSSKASGFCFKKPSGVPVFVLSLGRQRLIFSDVVLTDVQIQQVTHILEHIKPLFNYFIFELLLFMDQGQFVFACVTIDLVRSPHHPLFSEFLQEHLLEEFHQCLN